MVHLRRTFGLAFGAMLALQGVGHAHNKYRELSSGVPLVDYWEGNRAWADGTRAVLADSHHVLASGDFFYKFHLDVPSLVTVTVSTVTIPQPPPYTDIPATADPAFTLYGGLMTLMGHDDVSYDPLYPFNDDYTAQAASRTDAAPPGHVYTPHDGYRDTLNYSTTGGNYTPATDGGDSSLDGFAIHPYEGQFDALGDWSMANAYAVIGTPTIPSQCPIADCPDGNPVGDWTTIYYVTHKNDHMGLGGIPDTTPEVLTSMPLDPGDYTIIVGGGCPDCSDNGFVGGQVQLDVTPTTLTSDLLTGKTLVLKTKTGAPEKSTFKVQSADPAATLGAGGGSADDPTTAGATLRVHSLNGGFDDTYSLPASGWIAASKKGVVTGYKYKDKALVNGPISAATITLGKGIKVQGKGSALGHTLAVDPTPVTLTLATGTHRYCLRFGGLNKWKANSKAGSITVKNAAAPGVCAP